LTSVIEQIKTRLPSSPGLFPIRKVRIFGWIGFSIEGSRLRQLVLDKGADPKVVPKAGVTALTVAAGMAHAKTIHGGEQPIEAMKRCP
jgi:hypothetical protein